MPKLDWNQSDDPECAWVDDLQDGIGMGACNSGFWEVWSMDTANRIGHGKSESKITAMQQAEYWYQDYLKANEVTDEH